MESLPLSQMKEIWHLIDEIYALLMRVGDMNVFAEPVRRAIVEEGMRQVHTDFLVCEASLPKTYAVFLKGQMASLGYDFVERTVFYHGCDLDRAMWDHVLRSVISLFQNWSGVIEFQKVPEFDTPKDANAVVFDAGRRRDPALNPGSPMVSPPRRRQRIGSPTQPQPSSGLFRFSNPRMCFLTCALIFSGYSHGSLFGSCGSCSPESQGHPAPSATKGRTYVATPHPIFGLLRSHATDRITTRRP